MIRSFPLLLAALLFAAPATAQLGIGPRVSATVPTAAIGVPENNAGDLHPRRLGATTIEYTQRAGGADATRVRAPAVVRDGRFRQLSD